jgi:hypothetical protein
VKMDGVLYAVEGHARKHPWQPKAVVAVNVRQAYARDLVRRNACVDHLALCSLAGVKEESLTVPAQEVAIVVPGPGGHLGCGAQDNEFPHSFGRPKGRFRKNPGPALLDAVAA